MVAIVVRICLGVGAPFAYGFVAILHLQRAPAVSDEFAVETGRFLISYSTVILSCALTIGHRWSVLESWDAWRAMRHRYAVTRFVRALPRLPSGDWRLTDDCCPVCFTELDPDSARLTPCGHTFHGNCLELCLRVYKECPMCRGQLLHTAI